MKAGLNGTPLTLRSSLPGRQRWEVWPIRRKPTLAEKLELELRQCTGMLHARANAATGRVLVEFDEFILHDTADLMAELLAKLGVTAPENGSGVKRSPRDAGQPGVQPKLEYPGDNDLLKLVRSAESSNELRLKASGWTIVNTASSLVPPISLGAIIAVAALGGLPFLTSLGLSPLVQLGLFSGVFLGGNTLNTLTEYKSKQAWQAYATDVEHALRTRVFHHVLGLDMAFLEDESTSQILSVIHDDAVRIRGFLGAVPDNVIDRVATFGAGTVFLVLISPISFLLSLAPLPFILYLYRRFHKRIAESYGKVGEREQETRKLLANSLTGFTTILSFSMEDFELEQLETASAEVQKEVKDAFAQALKYGDLTKFAMVAGIGLPIIYGGRLLLLGKISPTVFMLQSFMMPKMIGTMGGLDSIYDQYQAASAASTRLTRLLNVRPDITSGEESVPAESVEGAVSFEQVSFTYPSSDEPVFDGFDLQIPARRSMAIVGATGSGKSTLTRLLLRFYDVNAGRVLLDGRDIRELDLADLRRVIGLVSQDVFLFHGTVADNILYGRPDASRKEVLEAARAAEALEFIEALPEGFDTIVGERGQKLSGGQRQRISIARVVLNNPPILIFDEATSSVDNETEVGILRSIYEIAHNKTLIIIAHRLSTVRGVDQIVVLEEGRLTEFGSHQELLEHGGAYAGLWELQA